MLSPCSNILSRFEHVFWADASNKNTLEQRYKGISAEILHDTPADDSVESALRVLEQFDKELLLLMDGADDPTVLSGLWPPGFKGNVLYTSRNSSLRDLPRSQSCHVDRLSEDEAVELLLKTAQKDDSVDSPGDLPARIVQELGYLALAIAQAGAYIKKGECGLRDFLALFQKHRKDLLGNDAYRGAREYDRAVYATWEMSYNALAKMNDEGARAALEILNIVAFFHHENIAVDIFRRAAESEWRPPPCLTPEDPEEVHKRRRELPPDILTLDSDAKRDNRLFRKGIRALLKLKLDKFRRAAKGECRATLCLDPEDADEEYLYCRELPLDILTLDSNAKWDSRLFRKGRRALLELSLINKDESSEYFGMHILVHGWAHDRQTPKDHATNFALAQSTLACSISWKKKSENFLFHRTLLPHVAACEAYEAKSSPIRVRFVEKVYFGLVFKHAGQWEETARLELQALEAARSELGDDHPRTLVIMADLANTYTALDCLEKAEDMAERALHLGRKTLGEEDRVILHCMQIYANVCVEQGKWTEAEGLLVRACDVSRKSLGEERSLTLNFMFGLALLFERQKRWEEAEDLYRKVLEARGRTLGREHPITLITMHNLALCLMERGRLHEASELLQEAVTLQSEIRGRHHPETVLSIEALEYVGAELDEEQELDGSGPE